MKAKIIQTLIICAVILAGFLAFYLKKPTIVPSMKPQSTEQKIETRLSTFTLPIDPKKDSHFGILGEGRGKDFEEEHVNEEVLKQLFEELKIRKVQAVFFGGNTVAGLEKEGKSGQSRPIDNEKLKKELQEFSKLYHDIFGDDVPFYPALGDREIVIPLSAKSFIDEFNLHGAVILGDELLYTVSAGQAFFAVIATDELIDGQTKVEEAFNEAMLEWLDKVLKDGAKTHKYLFVIGFEPAYPSTTTFSKERLPQRDAFWKTLVDNRVLAYFSSKEHLFDRSNRSGVWQIITGGGGAPFSQGGGISPFYHALVLTIPGEREAVEKENIPQAPIKKENKTQVPSIQVIDSNGNVVEEFTLGQDNQALYQMRISSNI